MISIRSASNPLREILLETHRFRAAGAVADQAFHHRHQCRAPVAAASSATARSLPTSLLASACLPTMFQAIEIDGDAYWDGGYAGNPTITPLVRECEVARHHFGSDQSARAPGDAAHRRAKFSTGSMKFPSTRRS